LPRPQPRYGLKQLGPSSWPRRIDGLDEQCRTAVSEIASIMLVTAPGMIAKNLIAPLATTYP